MSLIGGRERLARTAYRLKKAWLLCVGIVGVRNLPLKFSAMLTVPDYQSWSRAKLESQVKALEEDLEEILRATIRGTLGRKSLNRVAQWLEEQYEKWDAAGRGKYSISTVHEFERHVGPLRSRERMEVPAYGEMLLQGALGLAIRHPEYMLARDLELFFDLHQDADRLIGKATGISDAGWAETCGENRQSL